MILRVFMLKQLILCLLPIIVFSNEAKASQKVYLFNEPIANSCNKWAKEAAKGDDDKLFKYFEWCLRNQHKGGDSSYLNLNDIEKELIKGKPSQAKLEIIISKIIQMRNTKNPFAEPEKATTQKPVTVKDFSIYTIYIIE